MIDYTDSIPDECLALIFKHLKTTEDRNNSSLVSHRWLRIDAQTRTHLTLNAQSNLQPFIPLIFHRFISLTQLVLVLDRTSVISINDNDMALITSMSPNLTRLKLRACFHLTDSDVGLVSVAENCRALKKLRVGDWNGSEIGDEGLIAVGKHSVNLEELVLIGVKATCVSLQIIATNCHNLVRLEFARSDTITDMEMTCIADKCVALKILCIGECDSVSNKGIEAFALGCPDLAEIRVTCCKKVTREVKDRLRASRESLVVKLDAPDSWHQ